MSGFIPFDPNLTGTGVPAPDNVVYVEQESDFGVIVPATRIDVTPSTTFILNKPVTQTLPFLIATGSTMEIRTSNAFINTLTYTNASDAQFKGDNIRLGIFDVTMSGSSVATAFDIDEGVVSIKFPDFDNYDSLGTVRNLSDFYSIGCFFRVISDGLDVIDCSGITVSNALIFANSGNTFPFFNIIGGLSGDIQIIDNIINNDSFSTLVRVGPFYPDDQHVSVISNNVLVASNTFDTTGDTGTFTAVSDAAVSSTSITSVTDNGGLARFIFSVGPTLFVNQQVVLSGFTTNTSYNGTFLITFVGAGLFEVGVDFGSDEASGSFVSDSVTMTDTGTTLSDGDRVTIDTDSSTDYDGGAIVYNQLTNSFEVSRVFTSTAAGSWSTGGLDQKDSKVLSVNNAGSVNSKYICSAFVNNNLTDSGTIVNNTFKDVVFGTGGSALVEGSNMERWKLIDEINGTFEYTGSEPFDGSLEYDFSSFSTGGSQLFRFKWVIDTGSGFVDLDDNVESILSIGSNAKSLTKTQSLIISKGEQIKPQVTRNAGSSPITMNYATINASQ